MLKIVIVAVTVSVCVLGAWQSPLVARAALVTFDNMPTSTYNPNSGSAIYGPDRFFPGSAATQSGLQFSPTVSGFLSSVFAPMDMIFGVGDQVQLSLWSDNSNVPLSVVETSSRIVNPIVGGAILEWTWSDASLLQAGAKYWIVGETPASGRTVSWQSVLNGHGGAVRAARPLGEDWMIFMGNAGEMAMRVEVSPVPLPASSLLFITGVLLFSAVRRVRTS